jgi:hypothetical protein
MLLALPERIEPRPALALIWQRGPGKVPMQRIRYSHVLGIRLDPLDDLQLSECHWGLTALGGLMSIRNGGWFERPPLVMSEIERLRAMGEGS